MASSRKFRENPGIQRYPKDERGWRHWINEVAKWIAEKEDLGYWIGQPGSIIWRSDSSGVYPAGDPEEDLYISFYDVDATVIATRTLRGTLESSTGNITVTNVASTGLTSEYALYGDGTDSVRADIIVTLNTGSTIQGSLTWNSIDLSTSGTTPGTTSGTGGGGGGGGTK